MKKLIIKKRDDLKYLPSHKYKIEGYHEDGSLWFSTSYRTKKECLDLADSMRKPFPIGNRMTTAEYDVEVL